MAFVRMLVKCQEHIRFIPCAQDFSRPNADLKNRRTAGNGRGNRHEGHDFLLASPREARQKSADGLDAVLGVAGNTDDRLLDFGDFG